METVRDSVYAWEVVIWDSHITLSVEEEIRDIGNLIKKHSTNIFVKKAAAQPVPYMCKMYINHDILGF